MRFDVLTLFPEIFNGFFDVAIPKRAAALGTAEFHLHQYLIDCDEPSRMRDSSSPRRMLPAGHAGRKGAQVLPPSRKLPVGPVVATVAEVERKVNVPGHLIMLSPQGRKLSHGVVKELARHPRLIVMCGRFGGFDPQIAEELQPDEISIGDYVLSGGEPAAMVLIDAVLRLLPQSLPD